MKTAWLVPCLLAVCVSAGCAQNDQQQSKQAGQQNKQSGQGQKQNGGQKKNGGQQQNQQNNGQNDTTTPDLADGPERNVREPRPLSLADLHQKYPSRFILEGPRGVRQVALTFDDAPDATFTPRVLDALKKAGVRATFFVVGNRVEAHPDLVKRMVAEGHVLGNHSYSHANLPKLSNDKFRAEIKKTDRIIRKYTGYEPTYVRPPYGNINEDQIRWLASEEKRIVNWNVDTLDWKGLDVGQVSTNCLAHVRQGSIILQHAAGGKGEDLTGTVNAIPRIVAKLKKDGVRFVTIPEMLRASSR